MPAETHQLFGAEREFAVSDAFRRSLEIRKIVARHLLMRADQQMRELPPSGSGLRQELGDRCLQQRLGEQKRGLERHAGGAAGALAERRGLPFGIAVEKPARLPLEHRRQQREHIFRRNPLAALDHAQVGDRWGAVRIELDAARRQLFQRQPVTLAQGTQLGAEEVGLVGVLGHRGCEINTVKFPKSNLSVSGPILVAARDQWTEGTGEIQRSYSRGLLRLLVRHQTADGRAPSLASVHPAHRGSDQARRDPGALPGPRSRVAARDRVEDPSGCAFGEHPRRDRSPRVRPGRAGHAGGPVRLARRPGSDGTHYPGAQAVPCDHEHATPALSQAYSRAFDGSSWKPAMRIPRSGRASNRA